eukprot:483341-Rhodomonas_salina.2
MQPWQRVKGSWTESEVQTWVLESSPVGNSLLKPWTHTSRQTKGEKLVTSIDVKRGCGGQCRRMLGANAIHQRVSRSSIERTEVGVAYDESRSQSA